MNFHDAKGILCNAEETGDTFKLGLLHYEMEMDLDVAARVMRELMGFVRRGTAWGPADFWPQRHILHKAIQAAKQDPHGGKVMLSIEDAESLLGERQ